MDNKIEDYLLANTISDVAYEEKDGVIYGVLIKFLDGTNIHLESEAKHPLIIRWVAGSKSFSSKD